MTQQSRQVLKHTFRTGAQPTESDYGDLIDSALNYQDDFISAPTPDSPVGFGVTAENAKVMNFSDKQGLQWQFSLESDGQQGFSLEDNNGVSTLFVQNGSHNIGINQSDPDALLHVTNNGTQSYSFRVDDNTLDADVAFVVANDGKVGIGISEPKAMLDITYDDATYPFVKVSSGGPQDAEFTLSPEGFIGLATETPEARISIQQVNTPGTPAVDLLNVHNSDNKTICKIDASGGLHLKVEEEKIKPELTLQTNGVSELNGHLAVNGKTDITGDLNVKGKNHITESLQVGGGQVIKQFSNESQFTGAEDKVPTQNAVEKYVNNRIAEIDSGLPSGAIIMWWGTTIPEGWLLCDGKDGKSPDLRGRFVIGAATEIDSDYRINGIGGEYTTKLAEDNLPAHAHPIVDPGHSHTLGAIGNGQHWYDGGEHGGDSMTNKSETDISVVENSRHIAKPFSRLPPYYALYYIIKL